MYRGILHRHVPEIKFGTRSMKYLPKYVTVDENVNVVHTLSMYDRRHDLRSMDSEVGTGEGIRFGGSKINPN